MRLRSLTIGNFRGFGPGVEAIDLDADLVLLYGPNGHGKTSLAEAVEWLFYGTTKRRVRGERFSKAEYSGTFANAHGGKPTEVSLQVRLGGCDVSLTRRMGEREHSETFVDGHPADFSAVGVVPLEAYYPVVAQHDLQTFVHSKPKDRRDAICAALGLEELTELKAALESARSSFQRMPPQDVVEARKRVTALAPILARVRAATLLAREWAATPPVINVERDTTALLSAAAEVLGTPVGNIEDGLTKLRAERAKAGKAVLDVTPIEPHREHASLRQGAFNRLEDLRRAAATVDEAVGVLAGATAASYGAALLNFWTEGLVLAPRGVDCPMCESPTLSASQRLKLEKRIAEAAGTIRASTALGNALEVWQVAQVLSVGAIAALGISGLDGSARASLSQLLEASAGLQPYLDAHDAFVAAQRDLGDTLRSDMDLGRTTQERCALPDGFPDLIRDRQTSRDALARTVAGFDQALDSYERAWAAIAAAVAEKIAATEAVAVIDAVGVALKDLDDLRLLERFAGVLHDVQALIRSVEATTQAKQAVLLQSRGKEVKALYALLNPGVSVGFETMEPANDALRLHATSFGTRMPAAANLSECQLNCLGLSVWLMRATTPSSPFGFIVLDDPVQAMDDDHAEAFVAQVIPHLLDRQRKQVVVLSHVKHVIDRLRSLNIAREIRHYHFENFERGGPVIVRQERLQQMLAEIKGATNGNESNRLFAVDRLRVLVEAMVRELHLRKTGQPAPPDLDSANSGALADLFRSIPATEPAEHAGLRDTIRFCDPAHHTQIGFAVPLKPQIQPHIDRVSGLMRKYCLTT
ncbi:MAG: AAA family ATPase [Janthinobacterium lividum]